MAQRKDSVLDFLNEGLDGKTEFRFYEDKGGLCVWFYVGKDRKRKATTLRCPEAVDVKFRAEAREAANAIVRAHRSGRVLEATREERVQVSSTLDELRAAWIKEIEKQYPDSWKARHYQINNVAKFFNGQDDGMSTPLQLMTSDEGPQLFVNARMRERDKGTVKHEVGAMFLFMDWCKLKKYISKVPNRPKYRPKDYGTRVGPQRAEPVHLDDETALKIIMLLPEYAGRGSFGRDEKDDEGSFVCRDWMRFAFETGLRPSTVARLRVGPHWMPGWDHLRIPANIDKGRNAAQAGKTRIVPLTKVAIAILEKHAPKVGIIFGKSNGKPHDIRVQWKRAAIQVLGREEGERCAPYDLRHGANFRMRSTVGGSLGGAMHMLGQKKASTNDRYMKGSEKAAKDVVALLDERNKELEKASRARGRRSAPVR